MGYSVRQNDEGVVVSGDHGPIRWVITVDQDGRVTVVNTEDVTILGCNKIRLNACRDVAIEDSEQVGFTRCNLREQKG